MSLGAPRSGLQLRSVVTADGTLRLSVDAVDVPEPASDEVVVRVEATPMNPSDIGTLLGAADPSSAVRSGAGGHAVSTLAIPAPARAGMRSREGVPTTAGFEGAGVVVAAGSSPAAQALLGRPVAVLANGMHAQFRCVKVAQCTPLPEATAPADAASAFVNPLTALGMVETMHREGHTALLHTAAASNLGQMLNRLCLADGIGLVNVVRRAEQAELLRSQGALHVCSTDSTGFVAELTAHLAATGATLAFDATGGGWLATRILAAMEAAITGGADVGRYGSDVHKQVYLYGTLDPSPTEIVRNFGAAWGIGGWLVFPFLKKIGEPAAASLKARVMAELKTTFRSGYSRTISLRDALEPATIAAFGKRATGEKFLFDPTADAGTGGALDA